MDKREQIENEIVELVLGDNSISIKVRNMDSIEEDYTKLKELLIELLPYYKGSELISKRLSYALFDILSCFSQSTNFYSEEEIVNLENKKDELYDLLIVLFES